MPQTYKELNNRCVLKMNKVVVRASKYMMIIYLIIGIFGYLIFSDKLEATLHCPTTGGNILECDFNGSFSIQVARFFVTIALVAAAPLCFIPAKTSFFEASFIC